MARKMKSVYERIEETLADIAYTEQQLGELRTQLQNLYDEKDELEMRQIWASIKNNGLTIEDVQSLISQQNQSAK